MIIENEGTYTLRYTATDDCGKTTTMDRELVVQNLPYGVYWDGSESSAWTRIGKAASFEEPIPQYSDGNGGWIGGSSPFDNLMPWSGMQIMEDAEAGTLVSIPKFYYKWTHGLGESGNGLQLEISDKPLDGFFTSPAHADRGDGVGERDVVYVGRYHCCEIDFKSTTGIVPRSSVKRQNFRTSIHALGNDIWQYDFAMYWTIAMLYLVEFADWNSQAVIGYGCSLMGSKQDNGATDTMQYHTGTEATARDAYGQVQYRHIEGLWSNVRDWCDGIYFDSSDNVYVINNPSDFSDNSNGTLVGTKSTSSGTPKTFNTPTVPGYEYALYPTTVDGSAYTVRTCDRYNYAASGTVLNVGGDVNQDQSYGLFYIDCGYAATSQIGRVGSRLMKLPNA